MSEFSNLKFKWRYDMPTGLSGLINGHIVYINGRNPREKQTETIAEEIGHAETSVGDITHYPDGDSATQELKARRWGMEYLVTLDDLIQLSEEPWCDWIDAAEKLDISVEYLQNCVANWRNRLGEHFTYHCYEFDLSHGIQVSRQ